ncbi:hflK protein [Candidatus Endolissoclinum faulkneri L5]|uniref:Protein HflK n=1 Tax=Candidatus Endolissoclinum faulkneri L5 TaxID=1401328 RepID=V9TU13_9PROT|nr:FtsH protease activity modulator HflK [Candidatus Endolissoclinum faulkneri]AHC73652.1 hflK protein [Candidatus Endolissoclinum faulkneri L5]
MPWRDQGGRKRGPWGESNESGGLINSPWGRSRGNGGGSQGPSQNDIEDMLRRQQQKFRDMMPSGFISPRFIILAIFIVAFIWLISGFYRVQPNQQGIELVLGKYQGIPKGPGLQWNWPTPIGEIFLPDVTRENRIEIGFRSGVNERTNTRQDVPEESQMITGDENIIDIDFVVFWRIRNASNFLFNLHNPEQTVKVSAEAVMRDIVGNTKIQDALTECRGAIETSAQEQLQLLVNEYQAGIEIRSVQLNEVDPPAQVIDAFNEVTRARQDLERLKNEAEGYRNDVVPRARGEAAQIIENADAYRQEVVNRAQGDANRFSSVYEAYKRAKKLTTRRIYLDTLEEILSNINKVIIDDNVKNSGVIPYLHLPEIHKLFSNNRLTKDSSPKIKGGGE